MATVKYTEEHEWISVDAGIGTVGITDYAQEQLGDVVFVEVPEIGRTVAKGEAIAVVESVKAASDIYAPVSGEVVGANGTLADSPGNVNLEPTGNGWFFRIKLADPAELDGLMDQAAYDAFVAGLA